MSIHSNKGTVEIDGKGEDILTELSMIVYALKQADIPDELIEIAMKNGIEEYNKENLKEEKNDHFKSILKKLGLEG